MQDHLLHLFALFTKRILFNFPYLPDIQLTWRQEADFTSQLLRSKIPLEDHKVIFITKERPFIIKK